MRASSLHVFAHQLKESTYAPITLMHAATKAPGPSEFMVLFGTKEMVYGLPIKFQPTSPLYLKG
jgi:hypothetical protein